jgi:hypothetical protein
MTMDMSKYERGALVAMLERLRKTTGGCDVVMHKPENQGVSAVTTGWEFDNASGDYPQASSYRMSLGIQRKGQPKIQWFNLANLVALARMADLSSFGDLKQYMVGNVAVPNDR